MDVDTETPAIVVPVAGGKAPAVAAPAVKIVTDLSASDVQTKYRDAATIANAALASVLAALAPGKSVAELCELGDAAIEAACGKIYKGKKDMGKGVAFPTCISVNETIAHYSPFKSDSRVLAEGDAVKVDLGCHIDGFAALAAQTTVLRAVADAPLTGRQADVIAAAHHAAEIALRLIKPGSKGAAVTDAVTKVAAAFDVRVVTSVQCSLLAHYSLDGGKHVALRKEPGTKYEDATFGPHEAWCIEVAMTTGDGAPRDAEARTTVYRRVVEVRHGETGEEWREGEGREIECQAPILTEILLSLSIIFFVSYRRIPRAFRVCGTDPPSPPHPTSTFPPPLPSFNTE